MLAPYINVASGYSGTSTTVATWYSNITEGSTRYAKIIFKNIYGRTTTSTDLTSSSLYSGLP